MCKQAVNVQSVWCGSVYWADLRINITVFSQKSVSSKDLHFISSGMGVLYRCICTSLTTGVAISWGIILSFINPWRHIGISTTSGVLRALVGVLPPMTSSHTFIGQ